MAASYPAGSAIRLAAWLVLNIVSGFVSPRSTLRLPERPGGIATRVDRPGYRGGGPAHALPAVHQPVEWQQLKWVALGTGTAVAGFIAGAVILPMIPHSVIAQPAAVRVDGDDPDLDGPAPDSALDRAGLTAVPALGCRPPGPAGGHFRNSDRGGHGHLCGNRPGRERARASGSSRFWPLIAAVVVALLLQPVRSRLERSVNRIFYGQRDDPYAVMSDLGERLDESLSQETALPTIVETIASALRLPYVAIAMARTRICIAAQLGAPGSETVVFPLTSGSEPIGQLIVSPRGDGEAVQRGRPAIAGRCRPAGGSGGAGSTADQRVGTGQSASASVRSEERRRIRRDLHDGLGPLLASQMLILDSARTLMPADPALAGDLLDQLHQHIRTAVDDVRRLVNSLRPAALDELGLVAAIRDRVADLQRAGLRIEIDTPSELGPISAATETAAYRIVMEGVTNVLRHAHARECRISLATVDRAWLRIEIRDDGIGLPDQS